MRIKKESKSVGIVGKILNLFSNSKEDTYSCDYINNQIDKLLPHYINGLIITPEYDCIVEVFANTAGWGYDGCTTEATLNIPDGAELLAKNAVIVSGHNLVADAISVFGAFKLAKGKSYSFSIKGLSGGNTGISGCIKIVQIL